MKHNNFGRGPMVDLPDINTIILVGDLWCNNEMYLNCIVHNTITGISQWYDIGFVFMFIATNIHNILLLLDLQLLIYI